MSTLTTLTIRIPLELKKRLLKMSKQTGRSMNSISLDAIDNYLKLKSK
jgi:predicted DNA-binding protein